MLAVWHLAYSLGVTGNIPPFGLSTRQPARGT